MLGLCKQATTLGEDYFTGGRQVDPIAVTVEHANSELLFDLSDLVTNRGLYFVQMLSRTGETTVSHDGLDGF
jgi:hypothetical protein